MWLVLVGVARCWVLKGWSLLRRSFCSDHGLMARFVWLLVVVPPVF